MYQNPTSKYIFNGATLDTSPLRLGIVPRCLLSPCANIIISYVHHDVKKIASIAVQYLRLNRTMTAQDLCEDNTRRSIQMERYNTFMDC